MYFAPVGDFFVGVAARLEKNVERLSRSKMESEAPDDWYGCRMEGQTMVDEPAATHELENSLIDVAVESWRFARLFNRVVDKMDAGESKRYANQLRYFQKKVSDNLEAAGFKLVSVEGLPYDPGMAATALNIGDFGPDDELLVDQVVEPIIMGTEGLRRQGTVMLRKISR